MGDAVRRQEVARRVSADERGGAVLLARHRARAVRSQRHQQAHGDVRVLELLPHDAGEADARRVGDGHHAPVDGLEEAVLEQAQVEHHHVRIAAVRRLVYHQAEHVGLASVRVDVLPQYGSNRLKDVAGHDMIDICLSKVETVGTSKVAER